MTDEGGYGVLTDAQWAVLGPLIEAVRPRGKTPPKDLRRTIEAIIWRRQNGAKWREVPDKFGPWSRPAQLSIRRSRAGVWERPLDAARERAGGAELGLAFLDGSTIRAHAKAAGARKKGGRARSGTRARRSAARAAAVAPRP
jgi:transposase